MANDDRAQGRQDVLDVLRTMMPAEHADLVALAVERHAAMGRPAEPAATDAEAVARMTPKGKAKAKPVTRAQRAPRRTT